MDCKMDSQGKQVITYLESYEYRLGERSPDVESSVEKNLIMIWFFKGCWSPKCEIYI